MKPTHTMKTVAKAIFRCAIYCRVSTEERLGQEFNSLQAQFEAALAFILSQAHEGWEAVSERYEDPGYSGGNMDRPAFQRLMADARAGKFDCIVIYKLDRFSRSLRDFSVVFEELDKLGIAIVSVTQQFNTKTSMGRLIVNMLLTFAQFERELISERTRDKLAATRRKGLWTGGYHVLGFDIDPKSKRLIVNQSEAKVVAAIFTLYQKHKSLLPVVKELNKRGWVNKRWKTRSGPIRGGQPFTRTSLHRLLINVVYIGKMRYKAEIHPGEHEAIVDESTFYRVQEMLRSNGNGSKVRNRSGAILKGLLHCAPCGCAMVPSFTQRHSKRYAYYTCGKAQRSGWASCPSKSISAGAIERFIVERIAGIGNDPTVLHDTLETARQLDQDYRNQLDTERRVLERDLERWRTDIKQVVTGRGSSNMAGQLGDLRDRVASLETRLAEVNRSLVDLEDQPLDDADVAAALVQFQPIWEALTQAERAELFNLLIERIDYDGSKNQIAIRFHPTGLRAFTEQAEQRIGVSA